MAEISIMKCNSCSNEFLLGNRCSNKCNTSARFTDNSQTTYDTEKFDYELRVSQLQLDQSTPYFYRSH